MSASWEGSKENIQPLTQGRKLDCLMGSLSLVNNNQARRQLFDERKSLFESQLKDNESDQDRQLELWTEYIDWLEQNTPDGGKVNGLTNAIEQCIETYYDLRQFKQDKRVFQLFMKFKRFCDEPCEVFNFMYANSISILLAEFYLNWSWQYEMRRNMRRAQDLIKLGMKNLATPRETLEEALTQLRARIVSMMNAGQLDNTLQDGNLIPGGSYTGQDLASAGGIRTALQTLKFSKSSNKVRVNRIGSAVQRNNIGGLKSQTRVVNGLRVAKVKKTPAGGASSSVTNRRIEVLVEDPENAPPELMARLPGQTFSSVGRFGGTENEIAPRSRLAGNVSASRPVAAQVEPQQRQQPQFVVYRDEEDQVR